MTQNASPITGTAPTADPYGAVRHHLEELFGGLDGGWVHLCSPTVNAVHWYEATDLDAIARAAVKFNQQGDVWVSVNPRPSALGVQRGDAASVSAVTGFYWDIDYEDATHKGGKRRPSTREEALSLLDGLPAPTYVMHSGHGYQGGYLLHEPIDIADDSTRKEVTDLAASIQQALTNRAARNGQSIDNVSGIERVFRLNGLVNYKNRSAPVRAELVRAELVGEAPFSARYSMDDLWGVFGYVETDPLLKAPPAPLQVSVPTSAAVSEFMKSDRYLALTDVEGFAEIWEGTKAIADRSQSGYEFSLLNFLVNLSSWTDQQIVECVLARRAHFGDSKNRSLKESVANVERSLGKIRAEQRQKRALEQVREGVIAQVTSGEVDRLPLAAAAWAAKDAWPTMDKSQPALIPNIPGVVAWEKIEGDLNYYTLTTTSGRVRFSETEFSNFNTVADRLANHLPGVVAWKKPKNYADVWRGYVSLLSALAETTGTPATVVLIWLEDLATHRGKKLDAEVKIEHRLALLKGSMGDFSGGAFGVLDEKGNFHVRGKTLIEYVQHDRGEASMSDKEIKAQWVAAGGKTDVKVNLKRPAETDDDQDVATTDRTWCINLASLRARNTL